METVKPTMRDQLTRLHLKLLEQKLKTERDDLEEQTGRTQSTTRSGDGQRDAALHRALRRRKGLLHRLREQQAMASPRPQTWGGLRRHDLEPLQQLAPIHLYQSMPPEVPRVIQHTLPPPQPATIVQQLPQPQPLITQLMPLQPHSPIRSGSIKEEMVELMLMQNAQMHQIIMHNMMLKALPPTAFSPAPAPSSVTSAQDLQAGMKPRASSVHHHHHYASQGLPIAHPLWPSILPGVGGQLSPIQPAVHHVVGHAHTLPTLHTTAMDELRSQAPPGL